MTTLGSDAPYHPGKDFKVELDGVNYKVRLTEAAKDCPDVEGSLAESILKALESMKDKGIVPFNNELIVRKSGNAYNLAFYEKDDTDVAVVRLPTSSNNKNLEYKIR